MILLHYVSLGLGPGRKCKVVRIYSRAEELVLTSFIEIEEPFPLPVVAETCMRYSPICSRLTNTGRKIFLPRNVKPDKLKRLPIHMQQWHIEIL